VQLALAVGTVAILDTADVCRIVRARIEVAAGGGRMLLVPRQLQRVGMTGDVPYYGGRFTPAQAYAASHPKHRQAPAPSAAGPPAASPSATSPSATSPSATVDALTHLRDTGVITQEEYAKLLTRTQT
jgi:hypothetical protein